MSDPSFDAVTEKVYSNSENTNTNNIALNDIMWEPSPAYINETLMYQFKKHVDIHGGYEELWKWSVKHSDAFWETLMDFSDMQYSGSKHPVKEGTIMPDVEYFPNVQINFAENLLRHGRPESPLAHAEALVSISEARSDVRWTFTQLCQDASRVQNALANMGITEQDAVAAYVPNIGETVVAMLGTTSVGAMWSSTSPDFGVQAVVDRFSQIQPKVLFTADGYVAKGERVSMVQKVHELVAALPSIQRVVMIHMIGTETGEWQNNDRLATMSVSWDDFLKEGSRNDGSAPESKYTRLPFSHPQFVLYSSRTTGMPKSIVHGAGNILLQHAKELLLHSDLRPNDRMLFFTTCGWMMWNWMTSSLYAGATVVCWDGFAAYPRLSSPWNLVEREKITHMGTTPRYLQACRARVRPDRDNDLSALRVILSTGSPLAPQDFEYVYNHVHKDVLLASISGGTDICSCFALGNPMLPVRKGELQAIGLGLDVCAYDSDERESTVGIKAELVCKSPFVAAPVGFFGDDRQKSKYRSAYFRDEPGIWYHGDLVEFTGSVGEAGGLIIYGRSDTTLNPGGIRIGTAEVYRFAESVNAVVDSLVIGDVIKTGKRAGDVRIVLFVKLDDNLVLTPQLEEKIRCAIRTGASDAHVPAVMKQVQKIPYTKSGKKIEIAVRNLFAGGAVPNNLGAVLDPGAFDEYLKMAGEGL